MNIIYRKAGIEDIGAIAVFVDYWLTSGGQINGIKGATHDFFVPLGRHKKYLVKYEVLLAIFEGAIIGWAVKTHLGVLIHLLVGASFRGQGIGGEMIRRMDPVTVRSKSDQKSGDPAGFYGRCGYKKVEGERLGRKGNIELFVKGD